MTNLVGPVVMLPSKPIFLGKAHNRLVILQNIIMDHWVYLFRAKMPQMICIKLSEKIIMRQMRCHPFSSKVAQNNVKIKVMSSLLLV